MNLAVMQPYLFPYIGYFQLIYASDLFLLFDDVAYIKKGYINRNSIMMDGQPYRFTIPVPGASQNKKIYELSYSNDVDKVMKSISQAYSKAKHFDTIYPMIERVLSQPVRDIADLCLASYKEIFSYLGLEKSFKKTSTIDYDREQPAENRIIDLCNRFNADHYINPIGGIDLYSRENFERKKLKLSFLKPELVEYKQLSNGFISGLSIIDVLMNCRPDEIRSLLSKYELV
ncbi:WbqC family protein [Marinobacter sp. MA]|uniref:WbqC family protein n=1 Tax=Marinobacter sp. MA TaxID=2971606 RepID=UPI003AB0CB9E